MRLKTSWLFSSLITVAALLLLHYQISKIGYGSLLVEIGNIPLLKTALALAATAASFALLAASEWIACRQVIGGRVAASNAMFIGATGNSLSNTLGFHALTGGALRYRLYSTAGISLGDVSRIFSIASMGLGIGFAGTVALALIAAPSQLGSTGVIVGWVTLTAVLALLLWLSNQPKSINIARWRLIFPTRRIAALLALIGIVEMLIAIAGLYVLLPTEAQPNFLSFSLNYITAVGAGLISTAPGGIGVFETFVLANFNAAQQTAVMGSLIAYRLIYNLLPFAITLMALMLHELRSAAKR